MNAQSFASRSLSFCAAAVLAALAVPSIASAAAVGPAVCGDLRPPGQYGPFDYRTATSENKHRVEDYHFTPSIEMLRGGGTAGLSAGDIDYTLRAFPNNPRALLTISRYSTKFKTERPQGARFMVECYFERAIRFVPDDPMPYVIYASYLKDRNRIPEAREQLKRAEERRGEPSTYDLDYNLGILYASLGEMDRAAVAGRRAYDLGAPLPGLKNKLVAAGKWRDTGEKTAQRAKVADEPPAVQPSIGP